MISPSSIHSLIILSIGQDTSLTILVMKFLIYGLPVKIKELIAEQIAPPLSPLTESQITANHFNLSSGS